MIQNLIKFYRKNAGWCRLAGIITIMAVTGAFYLVGRDREGELTTQQLEVKAQDTAQITQSGQSEEARTADPADNEQSTNETQVQLFVHVCGSVNDPGVYAVAEGTRIYQAVELAGGMAEDANESYLNMAEVVSDGQKIYVPSQQEQPEENGNEMSGLAGMTSNAGGSQSGLESGQTGSKVNINTATKEQLMTLPGIGESRANDIITYRQTNGKFSEIEDIKNISGIKEAAFNKIKDQITVR